MPTLVIKQVPPELHRRLREEAERNHRSMNKQVIAILEETLGAPSPPDRVVPVKGKFGLTDRWLNEARAKGRPFP